MQTSSIPIFDAGLSIDLFREEILSGLRGFPKTLPCKYFYDARGSRLFEEICTLPEYYLTRTELAIMETHVEGMAAALGSGCCIIEYGSGAGIKVRLLLEHLKNPVAYVPVDLSRDSLVRAAAELSREFRSLQVRPVRADFSRPFPLPPLSGRILRRIVYFPGSTIGNFSPGEIVGLLRQMGVLCGKSGAVLLGLDLKKDRSLLEAAYNDSRGVTREFNFNLLRQINERLEGTFNFSRFRHKAFYNETLGRIEMHLESVEDQIVKVAGKTISFRKGETIHTENSYKFTVEEFEEYSRLADLRLERSWTDENRNFGVLYLPCQ